MKEDRWMKAAFNDSNMVAHLLLRLKYPSNHHQNPSPPPPPPPPFLPPVAWGQKQPRSTPTRKYPSTTTTTTTTKYSPRTPLSWSGATASPSDGGGDESSVSCTQPSSSSRSKNFSKLKEEETVLLKEERVNLKRDLKSVHVNLKKQRNKSDKLKRIKCDLNQQSTERGALPAKPEVQLAKHCNQMGVSTAKFHQSILPRHAMKKDSALANPCGVQQVPETNKRGFFLPDLNMPVGDDDIAAELW